MANAGIFLREINWDKSDAFRGDYFFLSNFYACRVEYRDFIYPSSEHAFAAQKANNPKERKHIALASTPGLAKARGRNCFLRKDWEEVKDMVMLEIVRAKFNGNPELGKMLLDTGIAEIIEWNTWGDMYWGKVERPRVMHQQLDYDGKNMLGKILMRVRTEIREKESEKEHATNT